jgi:hypothetical protein
MGYSTRILEKPKKGKHVMNEITTMHTLPVAVPPMLEAAIGYQGDAHLVAFFLRCW